MKLNIPPPSPIDIHKVTRTSYFQYGVMQACKYHLMVGRDHNLSEPVWVSLDCARMYQHCCNRLSPPHVCDAVVLLLSRFFARLLLLAVDLQRPLMLLLLISPHHWTMPVESWMVHCVNRCGSAPSNWVQSVNLR